MPEDLFVTTTVAGQSDIGRVRQNNEDNFLIADLGTGRVYLIPQKVTHSQEQNRLLLAVSDGVGGANSGEIASSMAVHSLRVELLKRNRGPVSPFDRLVQAVEKANSLIWSESQNNPSRRGMGATITAALIERDVAYVAEVGDSRGYLIHGGRIKQITTDQSLVGILMERGLLSAEQAKNAPARNIILQSLGYQAEVKVAVTSIELAAGDYLLLCSDGLSNKLKDEEMHEIIAKHANVEDAVRELIETANRRGGEDNITAVLARFEGDALRPASYSGSLTTRIEILSAYDPDSVGQAKKIKVKVSNSASQPAEPKMRDTIEMSSEKAPDQASFAKTIDIGKVPIKYNYAQLHEQAHTSMHQLVLAIASLRKQLEIFNSFCYWAERNSAKKAELKRSCKMLEDLIGELERRKCELEDLNRSASQKIK